MHKCSHRHSISYDLKSIRHRALGNYVVVLSDYIKVEGCP